MAPIQIYVCAVAVVTALGTLPLKSQAEIPLGSMAFSLPASYQANTPGNGQLRLSTEYPLQWLGHSGSGSIWRNDSPPSSSLGYEAAFPGSFTPTSVNQIRLILDITTTSAGIVLADGFLQITDVDGDILTGAISGLFQGGIFVAGESQPFAFSDIGAQDGFFDGTLGYLEPSYGVTQPAIRIRYIGLSSPVSFESSFFTEYASFWADVVPSPSGLSVALLFGTLVIRRRRSSCY